MHGLERDRFGQLFFVNLLAIGHILVTHSESSFEPSKLNRSTTFQ